MTALPSPSLQLHKYRLLLSYKYMYKFVEYVHMCVVPAGARGHSSEAQAAAILCECWEPLCKGSQAPNH